MSSTVMVHCLGRFRIELDGEPVPIPDGGRPLAVLKFLAARAGRPTPRDVLLEVLWPEVSPDASTNRLRVAVHALRRCLGDTAAHLVEHTDGCYVFSPNNATHLDTEMFQQAWRHGIAAERMSDAGTARHSLEMAESLYAGDFLEEDVYEDWTLVDREFLRDTFLNVLTKLAVLSLEERDFAGCLDRCMQIIRHDVCNEEAYGLLLEAHIAIGQPGRTAYWFSICERNLDRELNSAPSEKLIALMSTVSSGAGRRPANARRTAD
ncbi:MAG: BTAD domain-containing putative transcriptional regulator [Chloroflexi bacterium]|nr:BTAD domain-containing putative transcriptional regulator [Chloroflexota bacterium]